MSSAQEMAQAQWLQGQGLTGQIGGNYAPPPTIAEQIKARIGGLREALSRVDAQRAELAKLERMLAAAEEVQP